MEFYTPLIKFFDPLLCEINNARCRCFYVPGLVAGESRIQIDSDSSIEKIEPLNYLLTDNNQIRLTTEYLSPYDGFIYPAVAGWY